MVLPSIRVETWTKESNMHVRARSDVQTTLNVMTVTVKWTDIVHNPYGPNLDLL